MRRSMTNGLGQLARVDEPGDPNTNNSLDSPPQQTSYTYDALGNLVTVNQGTQTRSFAYSSLSRLLTATNPESGTIGYTYDPNGNRAMTGYVTGTDNRLLGDGTWTYSSDAEGNLVEKVRADGSTRWTYSYDNANHLVAAESWTPGALGGWASRHDGAKRL